MFYAGSNCPASCCVGSNKTPRLLWLTPGWPWPSLTPAYMIGQYWDKFLPHRLTDCLAREPSLLSALVNTFSCWILGPTSMDHSYIGHVLVTGLQYQQYHHLTDLSLTTRDSNSFYHQSGFTTDVILKASSSWSSSQQKYILYFVFFCLQGRKCRQVLVERGQRQRGDRGPILEWYHRHQDPAGSGIGPGRDTDKDSHYPQYLWQLT